jgi:hypothetical protein
MKTLQFIPSTLYQTPNHPSLLKSCRGCMRCNKDVVEMWWSTSNRGHFIPSTPFHTVVHACVDGGMEGAGNCYGNTVVMLCKCCAEYMSDIVEARRVFITFFIVNLYSRLFWCVRLLMETQAGQLVSSNRSATITSQ